MSRFRDNALSNQPTRIDTRPQSDPAVAAGMRGLHRDTRGRVIGGYTAEGQGIGTKAGRSVSQRRNEAPPKLSLLPNQTVAGNSPPSATASGFSQRSYAAAPSPVVAPTTVPGQPVPPTNGAATAPSEGKIDGMPASQAIVQATNRANAILSGASSKVRQRAKDNAVTASEMDAIKGFQRAYTVAGEFRKVNPPRPANPVPVTPQFPPIATTPTPQSIGAELPSPVTAPAPPAMTNASAQPSRFRTEPPPPSSAPPKRGMGGDSALTDKRVEDRSAAMKKATKASNTNLAVNAAMVLANVRRFRRNMVETAEKSRVNEIALNDAAAARVTASWKKQTGR